MRHGGIPKRSCSQAQKTPPSQSLADRALSITAPVHEIRATLAQLRAHGARADDAILLDEDIDHETPVKPRTERPRITSILKARLPRASVLADLRSRGVTLAQASPDGNCAQRSALASLGQLSQSAATSCDSVTMQHLALQRARVVDRLIGSSTALPSDESGAAISVPELRKALRVSSSEIEPFRRLGHWLDSDSAFIAFLWGLADDLSIPLAVLTREADDTFVDPPCVYRAQPPGGRRENAGAFSYVPFDELLGWLDRSEVWPPFALVEFVPGHYSPFLFATKR